MLYVFKLVLISGGWLNRCVTWSGSIEDFSHQVALPASLQDSGRLFLLLRGLPTTPALWSTICYTHTFTHTATSTHGLSQCMYEPDDTTFFWDIHDKHIHTHTQTYLRVCLCPLCCDNGVWGHQSGSALLTAHQWLIYGIAQSRTYCKLLH